MNACLRPRRLSVGWRCYELFHPLPSLPYESRPVNWIQRTINATSRLRSLSGSCCCPDSIESKFSKTRHADFQPREQHSPPICVTIIGGNNCKLCCKAVLSIRRIISSLGLLLNNQAQPDQLCPTPRSPAVGSAASALCLPVSPGQRLCTYGKDVREFGARDIVGSGSVFRDKDSKFVRASWSRSGQCVGASHQPHQASNHDFQEEVVNETYESRDSGSSIVVVRVRQVNLERPAERHQLGLSSRQAQTLRTEVPIILVGSKEVCRLKFDGPAVRLALLETLNNLHADR